MDSHLESESARLLPPEEENKDDIQPKRWEESTSIPSESAYKEFEGKREPCAYEEECQHPACNCGKMIEPFNKECPKCRTKDFASCHSMHCPVRKPVSAPSESQEELWQSSNPNKERYVQLSNVHSDGMPEPWLRFWEQIEIWYGDIQKRETGVQLLERLRKEGFTITRNP